MKSTRKSTSHRSRKLPPHTYEAHPAASGGEVKKPFVTAIVVVASIIILSTLLLFSERIFVGKAYTGAVNTAGIQDVIQTDTVGFSLTVETNIGTAETVAIGFNVSLPANLNCNDLSLSLPIQSLLGWDSSNGAVLEVAQCNPATNQVVFEYATLNWSTARTGEFDIARLNFNRLNAGSYALDFPYFEIAELANPSTILVASGEGGTITVQTAQNLCGDGLLNAGETCDDGNVISFDGCSSTCQAEIGYTCTGQPSVCTPFADADGDGVPDNSDNCPNDPNGGQTGILQESQQSTYSVGNLLYDVSLDSITPTPAAVFTVDGLTTSPIIEGGSFPLADGSEIIVTTINSGANTVGFLVGAQRDSDGDNIGDACDVGGPVCGNALVEAGETCDSTSQSCTINGYIGTQSCNAQCTGYGSCISTQSCGDNVINGPEVCDEGSLNGQPGRCNTQCTGVTSALCGNGVLNAGEACDDADTTSGDGCSSACTVETGYTCSGQPSVCTTIPITTQGTFTTVITATATTAQSTIYTTLLTANREIVVFKSERMPAMTAGQTYTSTVTYPFPANVRTKEVLVQDVPPNQGRTVYAFQTDDVTVAGSITVTGTKITVR